MLDDDIIRLRALEKSDLLAIHRWENLSAYWRTSATLAPYSLRNVMDYLNTYEADPFHRGELRLMIEQKEGERPLGLVDLYDVEVLHRRANVGIIVDPALQRRGVAIRALKLLERYCGSHLALYQLLAYVPADNEPSLALFRSAGYSEVARMPRWLATGGRMTDAVVWQKYLSLV